MNKIIINNTKFNPALIDIVDFSRIRFIDSDFVGKFTIYSPCLQIQFSSASNKTKFSSPEEAIISVMSKSSTKDALPNTMNIYSFEIIEVIAILNKVGYYTNKEAEDILTKLNEDLDKLQELYKTFIDKGYAPCDLYNNSLNQYSIELSNKEKDVEKFNSFHKDKNLSSLFTLNDLNKILDKS